MLEISSLPGEISDLHALKLDVSGEILGVVFADGKEQSKLIFKNVSQIKFLPFVMEDVRQFEFLNDRGPSGEWRVAVTRQGADSRAERVSIISFSDSPSVTETTVFEISGSDEAVHIVKSKDETIVFVNVTTGRRQTRCIAVSPDSSNFTVMSTKPLLDLAVSATDSEVFAEHLPGHFVVFRKSAHQLKVSLVPDFGAEPVREFVVFETRQFALKDVDVFADAAVLYGHNACASPEILVLKFAPESGSASVESGQASEVKPSLALSEALRVPNERFALGKITPGLNSEFHSRHVNFEFQSPVVPKISLQLDLATSRVAVAHATELADDPDLASRVQAERIHVGDVPITMFRGSKSRSEAGVKTPCLVVNYGAYGEVLEPAFSGQLAYLLGRGWNVAFAHIRGGGDCGEDWHVKKAAKKESVDDWLNCVEFLSQTSRVYAQATSAGAAVLTAGLNDPRVSEALKDGGVILRMPFVDVLGAMSAGSGEHGRSELSGISIIEQDEWGRVQVPEEADWLRRFSALQNVTEKIKYPPLFVTAAVDDVRVDFTAVKEYVAKVRALGTRAELNEVSGGHFGRLDAEAFIDMEANELAFLLECESINK